jgi:hypothetical protein
MLFFFLVVFLQQVAGYSALEAGTATLPVTIVMFVLSGRFGALADRHGPHLFLSLGPLIAAGGYAMLLRLGANADYVTELLPSLLIFSVGLSMTVAPLTATVLADADASNAGIASAVNNAIARVAGLIAIAAIGAIVSGAIKDDITIPGAASTELRSALSRAREAPFATPSTAGLSSSNAQFLRAEVTDASVYGFHYAVAVGSLLVLSAGLLGALGLRNPSCKDRRASQWPPARTSATSRSSPTSTTGRRRWSTPCSGRAARFAPTRPWTSACSTATTSSARRASRSSPRTRRCITAA